MPAYSVQYINTDDPEGDSEWFFLLPKIPSQEEIELFFIGMDFSVGVTERVKKLVKREMKARRVLIKPEDIFESLEDDDDWACNMGRVNVYPVNECGEKDFRKRVEAGRKKVLSGALDSVKELSVDMEQEL